MATIVSAPAEIRPGYQGFVAFCALIGEPLEPYMRRIAKAHFGPARETVAIISRGNFKTHLAALIGLHNLLTVPDAEVVIGAPSRRQAEIVLDRMKRFAAHPAVEDRVTLRHWQLRSEETRGMLDVVSADGALAHGFSPTLFIGDETWAWRERSGLLEAAETGLLKRPNGKVLLISTAAAQLDSPLGRLRTRALAQPDVTRRGVVTEAKGDLHWLEWSLADDESLDDMRLVAKVNPAGYITPKALAAQRAALPEHSFAQFHACRWGTSEGSWLPTGAWAACAGELAPPELPVYLGVDIGGARAASAVVGVTKELQVAEIHVYTGDEAVMDVVDCIVNIARRRPVIEVAHDPWRFRSEALRLEREHGLASVEVPMSSTRMGMISEGLHSVIVAKRLVHPNHPELNRHVAAAVARSTGRGWRIDKSADGVQIDALVALMIAVSRADQPGRQPAKLLGWL